MIHPPRGRQLDRETHLYGLAVPAGVVSQTGIAGLTLGGGVGWLVRKYGLTCDNVLSFELVTADGRLRNASAKQNPDLFWALRGGGGNFGVVTSFEFRAYPVGTVLGRLLVHPRERAGELLRFYRGFIATAPRELTAYCGLLHTPDGMPAAAIIACGSGERARGEKVLRPLRQFGPPLLDAIQPLPFPAMQSILDDGFPSGNQNYWKSAFLDGLSDDAIDLLVARANKAASPLSAVVVEYYAGAANKVAPTATAFAHRGMSYDIGILAQWTKPREAKRHIAWARGLADALKPHSSGAYYLNFLDQEGDATIRAAFGRNYARLARSKKKYDPGNFFRLNQNIPPARERRAGGGSVVVPMMPAAVSVVVPLLLVAEVLAVMPGRRAPAGVAPEARVVPVPPAMGAPVIPVGGRLVIGEDPVKAQAHGRPGMVAVPGLVLQPRGGVAEMPGAAGGRQCLRRTGTGGQAQGGQAGKNEPTHVLVSLLVSTPNLPASLHRGR